MLNWTKKSPAVEGWYWQRSYGRKADIVYVHKYGGNMCIMNWTIPNDSEWAGPFKEPKYEVK